MVGETMLVGDAAVKTMLAGDAVKTVERELG